MRSPSTDLLTAFDQSLKPPHCNGALLSIFEFVLTLSSVISGLALAHMIAGVVALLRNAKRVKFSLIHALWMWSAFATTVGNWAADWELRSMTHWPAWTLLILIASKIAQYAFCAFVTPDVPAAGEIDLRAFHQSERNGYLSAVVAFVVIALVFNLSFSGAFHYAQWLRDSLISLVALALTLLALFVGARWAQLLAAMGFAALAAYFLAVASNLGTT